MAGRKLTQLPTLTTPAPNDKVYIVDVSDTSESPQGTSKEIEVQNLGSGLTSIESTTLDVSIDDGVATVNGIGGDYEPTITNEVGLSSSTVTAGFYSRTGNIVTASFSIGLELAALSTSGTLDFSLPILPASNFANARKLTGVFSVNDGVLTDINTVKLSSTTGAKTGSLECQTTGAGVSVTVNILIQYSLS